MPKKSVIEPFRISEKVIVVEGGWLNSPWCPELISIPEQTKAFFALKRGDRGLAKALGFDMSSTNPLEDVDVFNHLSKLRDEAVDKLIRIAQANGDPMSENLMAPIVRGREKAFNDARIGDVVRVVVEPFKTEKGVQVEAMPVVMQTTSRRGAIPCVEMDETFLDWLASAARATWGRKRPAPSSSLAGYGFELPVLPEGMKYRKRGDALSVCCYCRRREVEDSSRDGHP